MPRIRTIKPEFFSDPDIGVLSLEARYLYVGMWLFADDEGRLPGDPRLLKSQVFPYDDKITVRKVSALVVELTRRHKTVPYEVAGVAYLELRNFLKHQKINRPQPAKYPRKLSEDSRNAPGVGSEDSSPLPDPTLSDPTTPPGDDDDSLQAFLENKGFHPSDVAVGVGKFEQRQRFGERIKDPVAWLTPMLEKLAAARRSTNGTPRTFEIDGDEMAWNAELDSWEVVASHA